MELEDESHNSFNVSGRTKVHFDGLVGSCFPDWSWMEQSEDYSFPQWSVGRRRLPMTCGKPIIGTGNIVFHSGLIYWIHMDMERVFDVIQQEQSYMKINSHTPKINSSSDSPTFHDSP